MFTMIAMGGFMAAAAHAVKAGNQNRASRIKAEEEARQRDIRTLRDSIDAGNAAHRHPFEARTAAEEEAARTYQSINRVVSEQNARCEESRLEAEAKLGRSETREEIIERECELLGYSPSSMTRSW